MIIFLYGPDSYRSKQKLDEIVDHYKKLRKSALNLLYIDAEKADFSDFYHTFRVAPMFAESKLVIVKNVFSNKKFQEDFLQEIKNVELLKDVVVVVYENQEVDQRLKLFKVLVKDCKSQACNMLDGKGVKSWAIEKFQEYQAKINNDALELLIRYVGNNLWQLSSEMKKLKDFRGTAVIRKDDVELLVKPNIEMDIFKTIDALAEKNKKQAMTFLQTHLDAADSPLYILSMIGYQFRNLLMVKELAEQGLLYASIVKKSGLHPFVVKKTYFQCRQFSFEELKNIYHAIFAIDADIKVGNIEPETALHLLVSQI